MTREEGAMTARSNGLRRVLAGLGGAAALMAAGSASATEYLAYTVLEGGSRARVTFEGGAADGRDLIYDIYETLLLRVRPGIWVVKVEYPDGTTYRTEVPMNASRSVKSTVMYDTRYWCLWVAKDNIAINSDEGCEALSRGDTSYTFTRSPQ
jgi:hypothetical protein